MFEKNELEELRREVKVITRRVEALERRLAERSAAEEALEKRRAISRRCMQRKRANVSQLLANKEDEKARRESPPHTPYKEKREKEEEISPDTRAREEVGCVDGLRRKCETWARAFWDAYPQGHRNDWFTKLMPLLVKEMMPNAGREDAIFGQIMDGLKRWKESDTWKRDFGRFIPSSERFLRNRIWADECLPEIRVESNRKPSRYGDIPVNPETAKLF